VFKLTDHYDKPDKISYISTKD